jgi:4-hydroxy-tetrahydrodipicolinate synthase
MFSGSIVALVTPMHSDGSVDFECMRRLVDWHVAQGTDGLVIAGTTGESATLGRDEHIEVIRVAAEHARGRIPVIAGTGSNSTTQTIDLSKAVEALPIEAYLLVVPYYNKPTQEGMYRHFSAVADSIGKPVMLYNVPGRTVADLQPETVARLAHHPRIFGIKEATGDLGRAARIRELCGPEFELFSGDDATAREFILAGGRGVVTVTGNLAPKLMAAMCAAALGHDRAQSAEFDALLADLHRDLFVEANPIPVKWGLERLGLIPPGIRLPLTPLSEPCRPVVESAMRRARLIGR